MVKRAYIAIGTVMLTFGSIMIISLTNLVPAMTSSLGQLVRAMPPGQSQYLPALMFGQKLSPLFAIGGATIIILGTRLKG